MSKSSTRPIVCLALTPCLQRTLQFHRLVQGEVNRARSVTVSLGGKTVNVALTLNTLGEEPMLTGFLGGITGTAMLGLLDERQIRHDFIFLSLPTRTCTTLVEEASGLVTELVEEAASPTAADWASLREKVAELLCVPSLVVASGALPPGSPADIYAHLAQTIAERSSSLVLDSRGEALLRALPHAPLLAKLNHHELAGMQSTVAPHNGASLASASAPMLASARQLTHGGADWVLVTRGAKSAWLMNDAETWEFTPPAVKAINPVGSGDATTAGVAYQLARGKAMPEAVRYGMACGAANALTLTPGTVDAGVVQELLPEVGIRKH